MDGALGLRPIVGVGAVGGLSEETDYHRWNVGGYGEMGATYLFTPHMSLGAVGELDLSRSRERQTYPGGSTTRDTWSASATLVRLIAAVYF